MVYFLVNITLVYFLIYITMIFFLNLYNNCSFSDIAGS